MNEEFESVHVHNMDVDSVVEQYRARGFVLQERTAPTIPAQPGFVKLIFAPRELAQPIRHLNNRRFWVR